MAKVSTTVLAALAVTSTTAARKAVAARIRATLAAKWLVTVVIAEGRAQGRPEDQLLRGKALEMGRRVANRYAATQLCDLALAKMEVEARRYVPPAPSALGCYTLVEESASVALASRNDEWTAQDELAWQYEEERIAEDNAEMVALLWPAEDNDWEAERLAFAVNDD